MSCADEILGFKLQITELSIQLNNILLLVTTVTEIALNEE